MPKEMSPWMDIDHLIKLLPSTHLPAQAPHQMAHPELTELHRQLDELFTVGIIQLLNAPFRISVPFQKKKRWIVSDICQLPGLEKIDGEEQILSSIGGRSFRSSKLSIGFSKLDLHFKYFQNRIITRGDEPKTICTTHYRLFEFLIMLFGLTNASITFYSLINIIF